MTNRGIIVMALVLVATVSLAAGLAAGGRLPVLSEAWDALAASAPTWLSPSDGGASGPTAERLASGDGGPAVHRQTAPLSSVQLGAPLVRGAFVSACGAPDTMKVVVKAAVKMGHAIDVTVKTDPPSSSVASCVEHATRDLQWDISPKVDHVTVSY